MEIDNIALVRATNIIPFDGVVKPISNVPYLTKNIGLEFSSRISNLLHNEGIIPPMDPTRMFDDGYYDEMVSFSSKMVKTYLPYVSDYNSIVLFSLNGICPDDNEHGFGNNTFSNKNCAVIEPLKNHLDQVISLVPTDTALKGNVTLSEESIILIREEVYQKLSDYEKSELAGFSVRLFQGSLKEAITNALKESGKYLPETLSLSASTGGFMPSDTSEMQKQFLTELTEKLGVSQQKYFNLITSMDPTMPKYSEVCNEYDRMLNVSNYFMEMFLNELLEELKAPDYMKSNLSNQLDRKPFCLKIVDLIKQYGLENYKSFVDRYNKNLVEQRQKGTLITPEEVIQSLEKNKKASI